MEPVNGIIMVYKFNIYFSQFEKIIFVFLIACFCGCSNENDQNFQYGYIWTKEYKISNTDTINVIDGNDWKQGVWINQNNDTIIYLNDTPYYVNQLNTSSKIITKLKIERHYNRQ